MRASCPQSILRAFIIEVNNRSFEQTARRALRFERANKKSDEQRQHSKHVVHFPRDVPVTPQFHSARVGKHKTSFSADLVSGAATPLWADLLTLCIGLYPRSEHPRVCSGASTRILFPTCSACKRRGPAGPVKRSALATAVEGRRGQVRSAGNAAAQDSDRSGPPR